MLFVEFLDIVSVQNQRKRSWEIWGKYIMKLQSSINPINTINHWETSTLEIEYKKIRLKSHLIPPVSNGCKFLFLFDIAFQSHNFYGSESICCWCCLVSFALEMILNGILSSISKRKQVCQQVTTEDVYK